MAQPTVPDHYLTADQFVQFMRDYAERTGNMFRVTLVKENGQGYNAVFQNSGTKERVALVSADDPRMVVGTWQVRDLVEKTLTRNGSFYSGTAATVDSTLQGLLGSVMLVVEHGDVVASHFHNGEIWP